MKFQSKSLRKESSTDEWVDTYHNTHRRKSGSKNQKSKLNTLLDLSSESINANKNQKTGIIKVKNQSTHCLLVTKKLCHQDKFVHQDNHTNFICKLKTRNSKNHIIRPK